MQELYLRKETEGKTDKENNILGKYLWVFSVHLWDCLLCLWVCLSVSLSVCPCFSVSVSVHVCVCLFVSVLVYSICLCLSVCICVCLSITVSVCLSLTSDESQHLCVRSYLCANLLQTFWSDTGTYERRNHILNLKITTKSINHNINLKNRNLIMNITTLICESQP